MTAVRASPHVPPALRATTGPASSVLWLDAESAEWTLRTPSFAAARAAWWCVPVGHSVIVLDAARRAEFPGLREQLVAMAELEHGPAARAPAAQRASLPDNDERASLEAMLLPQARFTGACVADLWAGTIRRVEAPTDAAPAAGRRGADGRGRARDAQAPDALECPLLGPVVTDEFRHDALGRPMVVTRLSAGAGLGAFFAFGTGATRREALRVATYEALERHQLATPQRDRHFVRATYRELGDAAVDPTTLGFGDCAAGAELDPRATPLHWVTAWSSREQRAMLVPAQDVWLQSAQLPAEPIFVQSTTSGTALGSTFAEAATHALLEAVERDAYLATWYLRRTPPRSAPVEPPACRVDVAAAFPTHRIVSYDVTTDTGITTSLAVATAAAGERVARCVHATTAGLHAGEVRQAAEIGLAMNPLTLSPDRWDAYTAAGQDLASVIEAELHYGVHAVGAASGGAAFLRPASPEAAPLPAHRFADSFDSPESAWEAVSARVLEAVSDILVVDLTHPGIRAKGLHCAKVLVPDLLPLWFGLRWRRVRVTPRLQSLAKAFGVPVPRTVDDLNQELHALG